MAPPLTLQHLADHLQATLVGDPHVVILGFAPASAAQPGFLTFAENAKYLELADNSQAAAILLPESLASTPCRKPVLLVPNARVAFAKALPLFFPERTFEPGIHPTAIIHPSAEIDPSAHIGPYCVLEEHVKVGARTSLQSHCSVGPRSVLGEDCRLYPRVTIYSETQIGNRVRLHSGCVLGSDGFGYVVDQGAHLKILQVGNVVVADDVEIGANVTIDRGALGSTRIGNGTKIDNLVQVAHNVTTGAHCLLVAQCGVAGSSQLGNYVTLAGQVGIAGHLKIGDQVIVAAQSGVMHDVPPKEQWLGSPAQPSRQAKKNIVATQQLPDLIKRIRALESELQTLKASSHPPQ